MDSIREALNENSFAQPELATAVIGGISDFIRPFEDGEEIPVRTEPSARRERSATTAAEVLRERYDALETLSRSRTFWATLPLECMLFGYEKALKWLTSRAVLAEDSRCWQALGNADLKTVLVDDDLDVYCSKDVQFSFSESREQAMFAVVANLLARTVCEDEILFAQLLCQGFIDELGNELVEAAINFGWITLIHHAVRQAVEQLGPGKELSYESFAGIEEPELLRLFDNYNRFIRLCRTYRPA
ncbi:MAG: hypothetical protein NUV85_02300 [Candidatus Berkelbacteria bacterium]|nr:hypothetical protein [Candidatus Berkelbacteria bacterium]